MVSIDIYILGWGSGLDSRSKSARNMERLPNFPPQVAFQFFLVQCYHHIHVPEHIQLVIKNLYTNFKTSIITCDFNTAFIEVGR